MSENPPAPNPPTPMAPAPTVVSVGNMQDVKGIVALVTVIGYLGISAAAIFTKTVPDPTPLLTGLGVLATAVVMFFFGTKSGQANQ
ncbi:MAG: hypothetical protein WB643_06440 [Candidatus Bathyarchaeia archaeon]